MARKKNRQDKPTGKDFSNNPFRSLEGLSAFDTRPNPPVDEKTTPVQPPSYMDADQTSFAEEMDFLGVRPLNKKNPEHPQPVARETIPEQSTSDALPHESETAVFLDALGSLEKVFKDEWGDEAPSKKATPRRMKQVARGQLKPEDQIDLHGLTVDEATRRVNFFLEKAAFQGQRTLLIITGKGLHSEQGPVLRKAIEVSLTHNPERVVEWGVAPRQYGGDGALIVFLRDNTVE